MGDLHLAIVTDKEAVKEHAQWQRSDTKDKAGAQTRMDPEASCVLDWGPGVICAGRGGA